MRFKKIIEFFAETFAEDFSYLEDLKKENNIQIKKSKNTTFETIEITIEIKLELKIVILKLTILNWKLPPKEPAHVAPIPLNPFLVDAVAQKLPKQEQLVEAVMQLTAFFI